MIPSKMRMKLEQEKSNTWPLAITTTISPYLILMIGSATLSKMMCNETNITIS